MEPSFVMCPYINARIPRYLEVVLERLTETSGSDNQTRSRQLVEDVLSEDWIRLELFMQTPMTYYDNRFANDATTSGTLFKLWESIRLHPNETNVSLMLKYLKTLLRLGNREFEEVYYYADLLRRLKKEGIRMTGPEVHFKQIRLGNEWLQKMENALLRFSYRVAVKSKVPRFVFHKLYALWQRSKANKDN
jgi:hypothetical protein